MKETKTNAMRILESKSIPYIPHSYPSGESHLSGEEVAKSLGIPPEIVFKTLVTEGKENHYVFVIPSHENLDIKKAAKACGEKKIDMLPMKELFGLTGYVRGGCSPVGMKKPFPTFMDETAILFDSIYMSAGKVGQQIEVSAELFAEAFDIIFADLTEIR